MPCRTNIKGLKQCKSLSSKTIDQRGDQRCDNLHDIPTRPVPGRVVHSFSRHGLETQ